MNHITALKNFNLNLIYNVSIFSLYTNKLLFLNKRRLHVSYSKKILNYAPNKYFKKRKYFLKKKISKKFFKIFKKKKFFKVTKNLRFKKKLIFKIRKNYFNFKKFEIAYRNSMLLLKKAIKEKIVEKTNKKEEIEEEEIEKEILFLRKNRTYKILKNSKNKKNITKNRKTINKNKNDIIKKNNITKRKKNVGKNKNNLIKNKKIINKNNLIKNKKIINKNNLIKNKKIIFKKKKIITKRKKKLNIVLFTNFKNNKLKKKKIKKNKMFKKNKKMPTQLTLKIFLTYFFNKNKKLKKSWFFKKIIWGIKKIYKRRFLKYRLISYYYPKIYIYNPIKPFKHVSFSKKIFFKIGLYQFLKKKFFKFHKKQFSKYEKRCLQKIGSFRLFKKLHKKFRRLRVRKMRSFPVKLLNIGRTYMDASKMHHLRYPFLLNFFFFKYNFYKTIIIKKFIYDFKFFFIKNCFINIHSLFFLKLKTSIMHFLKKFYNKFEQIKITKYYKIYQLVKILNLTIFKIIKKFSILKKKLYSLFPKKFSLFYVFDNFYLNSLKLLIKTIKCSTFFLMKNTNFLNDNSFIKNFNFIKKCYNNKLINLNDIIFLIKKFFKKNDTILKLYLSSFLSVYSKKKIIKTNIKKNFSFIIKKKKLQKKVYTFSNFIFNPINLKKTNVKMKNKKKKLNKISKYKIKRKFKHLKIRKFCNAFNFFASKKLESYIKHIKAIENNREKFFKAKKLINKGRKFVHDSLVYHIHKKYGRNRELREFYNYKILVKQYFNRYVKNLKRSIKEVYKLIMKKERYKFKVLRKHWRILKYFHYVLIRQRKHVFKKIDVLIEHFTEEFNKNVFKFLDIKKNFYAFSLKKKKLILKYLKFAITQLKKDQLASLKETRYFQRFFDEKKTFIGFVPKKYRIKKLFASRYYISPRKYTISPIKKVYNYGNFLSTLYINSPFTAIRFIRLSFKRFINTVSRVYDEKYNFFTRRGYYFSINRFIDSIKALEVNNFLSMLKKLSFMTWPKSFYEKKYNPLRKIKKKAVFALTFLSKKSLHNVFKNFSLLLLNKKFNALFNIYIFRKSEMSRAFNFKKNSQNKFLNDFLLLTQKYSLNLNLNSRYFLNNTVFSFNVRSNFWLNLRYNLFLIHSFLKSQKLKIFKNLSLYFNNHIIQDFFLIFSLIFKRIRWSRKNFYKKKPFGDIYHKMPILRKHSENFDLKVKDRRINRYRLYRFLNIFRQKRHRHMLIKRYSSYFKNQILNKLNKKLKKIRLKIIKKYFNNLKIFKNFIFLLVTNFKESRLVLEKDLFYFKKFKIKTYDFSFTKFFQNLIYHPTLSYYYEYYERKYIGETEYRTLNFIINAKKKYYRLKKRYLFSLHKKYKCFSLLKSQKYNRSFFGKKKLLLLKKNNFHFFHPKFKKQYFIPYLSPILKKFMAILNISGLRKHNIKIFNNFFLLLKYRLRNSLRKKKRKKKQFFSENRKKIRLPVRSFIKYIMNKSPNFRYTKIFDSGRFILMPQIIIYYHKMFPVIHYIRKYLLKYRISKNSSLKRSSSFFFQKQLRKFVVFFSKQIFYKRKVFIHGYFRHILNLSRTRLSNNFSGLKISQFKA